MIKQTTIKILFFQSLLLLLLASTFVLAKELDKSESSKILIYLTQSSTDAFTLSKSTPYQTITIGLPMVAEAQLDDAIFLIQSIIRTLIVNTLKENENPPQIVLYAKGFEATLMAVAQTNLLPEYRQYIRGMILEDAVMLLPASCTKKERDPICTLLKKFQLKVGSRASFIEMSKALSPQLQIDWYWPTVLLIANEDEKNYHRTWKALLEENGIAYQLVHLETLVPTKVEEEKSFQIQTFLNHLKKPSFQRHIDSPSYFGTILQFHLGKILYQSKNELKKLENIAYGEDAQQYYDVYFKKDSKKNPLFIYVHGGGWKEGDRKSFEGLCQQYADKGYTAVSIDYRLLDLPKVGMQEMVSDVSLAIKDILEKANDYHADSHQTVVMGESAGAQLAFMGIRALPKPLRKEIKALLLNSITSDLREHSKEKQIRLSGIQSDKLRQDWLNRYSPMKQLSGFYIPIFAMHSLTDTVVPAIHLDKLLVNSQQGTIIVPLWINSGVHPIAPDKKSLQPSYREIERKIDIFIKKQKNIKNIKK